MGIFNRETAIANSINLDTAIRYNEYIYSCLMNENRMNAEHRAVMVQKNKEAYEKLQKRIRENPEARDVNTGDGRLNSLLERLNDPKISDSCLDGGGPPAGGRGQAYPVQAGGEGSEELLLEAARGEGEG